MDYTISVNDNPKAIALQRALDVYNVSNQPLTPEGFMQKLIDGQLANLVASYVVTSLTNLEFEDRFTDAEWEAIHQAAATNATVARNVARFERADGISLTDPRTIAGVQALEAAGLIAAGRGAEVLAL